MLHFQPDDFRVTFAALPGEVRMRRETVNAHVTSESPESLTVRLRHRETVAVTVLPPAEKAEETAEAPAAAQ